MRIGQGGMSMLVCYIERCVPLVWDATCVVTLAPSHLLTAGGASAEMLKRRKSINLTWNSIFNPFEAETQKKEM